jgi:bifunctional non-homologous end joining protein LigD
VSVVGRAAQWGVVIATFDSMLATIDAVWPKDPVIEPKFDGVRSIITLHAEGTASIRSRDGKDVTSAYPELHERPSSLKGRDGVFDGEVIAVDEPADIASSSCNAA